MSGDSGYLLLYGSLMLKFLIAPSVQCLLVRVSRCPLAVEMAKDCQLLVLIA